MSAAAREEALSSCLQCLHELFYRLDESDYRALVQVFEPEGVWLRQGERLAGHDAILAALGRRSPTQRTRHLVTNDFVESSSETELNLRAYMLAYRFDDGTHHAGPVTVRNAFRLSVLKGRFCLGDNGWLIRELDMVPDFEFAA